MSKSRKNVIETIAHSIETKSMVRYKRQALDHYSASAIWAVYQKLSPEMQTKYAALAEKSLVKAASVAFQLCR